MRLLKNSRLIIITLALLPPVIIIAKSWISSYLKNKKYDPLRPKEEKRFGEEKDRDLVDEALWESFPCSDPPAHAARLD